MDNEDKEQFGEEMTDSINDFLDENIAFDMTKDPEAKLLPNAGETQIDDSYYDDYDYDDGVPEEEEGNFDKPDAKYNLLANDLLFESLVRAIAGGKNVLAQNMVMQSMKIDADWIVSIENGLFSIEQIIRRPKTFIKEERELVGVEKAKRVDGIAVRHLSTHTEYIKEVRKDGSIRPSKIMSRQLDQEVAIYENRFVYALVKRLESFVEKRYEIIKQQSLVKDNTVLSVNSNFKFGKADVEYKLYMSVKTPTKNRRLADQNDDLLNRLDTILQRLRLIEGTDFADIMSKAKPVKAPIMKTNLLAGNTDYRNCYNLWIMLSSFNSIGYAVDIMEKSLSFDDDYFEDLTKVIAASLEVMMLDNRIRRTIYKRIPKITKRQKKYKVAKKVEFEVKRMEGKVGDVDSGINQFYFEKIKAVAYEVAKLSEAYDTESFEKEHIDVNFRRFFKGIQKINNELFADLLKMNDLPNAEFKRPTLEQRRKELARQKNILKKYKLLTKLKKEEVRLSELREATQLKKMSKMEADIKKRERKLAIDKYQKELRKQVEKGKTKKRKGVRPADNDDED